MNINVQSSSYNATGNGTTDDTAAIQAALNVTGAKPSLLSNWKLQNDKYIICDSERHDAIGWV